MWTDHTLGHKVNLHEQNRDHIRCPLRSRHFNTAHKLPLGHWEKLRALETSLPNNLCFKEEVKAELRRFLDSGLRQETLRDTVVAILGGKFIASLQQEVIKDK